MVLRIAAAAFLLLALCLSAQAAQEDLPDRAVKANPIRAPYSRQSEDGLLPGIVRSAARNFGMRLKNVFTVSEIHLSGAYRAGNNELLELIPSSASIVTALGPTYLSRIKESPWVERLQASWSIYPLKLNISIQEAEPWLVAELPEGTWLVSRKGEILGSLSNLKDPALVVEVSELPRLDGLSQLNAAARFSDALRRLQNIELAGGLPFKLERITFFGEEGLLAQPAAGGDPKVLISGDSFDESGRALAQLAAVLADAATRGEHPALVDLRFRNQAIVR